MASVVKIKRSSVAGKRPTTSNIQAGELALNLADGRAFSSNGSVVFEIGANTHSLYVGTGGLSVGNGAFAFPTADGTSGQVLSTYGNGTVSWVDVATTLDAVVTNGNTTYQEITVGGLNIANNFTFPKTDGSSGQVLVTDGNGFVQWEDQSGSAALGFWADQRYYTVGANTKIFTVYKPRGTDLMVYHNGLKLSNTDYTANSSAVTLVTPATAGDVIELSVGRITTTSDQTFKRYTFTSNTSQTLFAGLDDDGVPLSHSITAVQVFLNGIQLIANTDYTLPADNKVLLSSGTANNDILSIISLSPVNQYVEATAAINSNSHTTQATSAEVVDRFAKASYRSAKYVVQLTNNANSTYQTTEVLLLHDGTTTYTTEYGTITSLNTLGVIDSNISGDWVNLTVAPINANTTIKVVRTAVAV